MWWIWVLFAVGNLIDIAVQGRDRSSLVAAFVLVALTGVIYTGAQRPRLIADEHGLTIVNPLREHRIGWAAVAAVDTADLVRVRCEWPSGPAGEPSGRKALYAWAVSSSRRRKALAQMRAERRSRSRLGSPAGAGFAGALGGNSPRDPAAPRVPETGDADKVVTVLRACADEARTAAPDAPATRPASTWSWPALAAAGLPLIALLILLAA